MIKMYFKEQLLGEFENVYEATKWLETNTEISRFDVYFVLPKMPVK